MIIKNSVVETQNPIVNHESRSIKSNFVSMYYLLDGRKAMNIVYVKIMSKFILRQYINIADKKNTSKYISLHHNWMHYHKNRAQHWSIFTIVWSHYNYQHGYYSKNYYIKLQKLLHKVSFIKYQVSFYLWWMEHILKLSKILKCYEIWTGPLIL